MQQMFGRSRGRRSWAEERRVGLQRYLEGAIAQKAHRHCPAFTAFVQSPDGEHCGSTAFGEQTNFDSAGSFVAQGQGRSPSPSETTSTAVLSRVLVRPLQELGVVEVIMRADSSLEPTSRRVQLSLRPRGLEQLPDGALLPAWDFELSPEMGSEARHRLQLRPGSAWEVVTLLTDGAGNWGCPLGLTFDVPKEDALDLGEN